MRTIEALLDSGPDPQRRVRGKHDSSIGISIWFWALLSTRPLRILTHPLMKGPFTDYEALAEQTRAAAVALPDLPPFSEARTADPRALFRELGYTFWNRELVDALSARLHGERITRWVELAAGTGRWAAELARRGVPVAATDDYSQAPERIRSNQRPIQYGAWVARMPAAEAMQHLRPEGVLCAWPPLGSGLLTCA
jgi:hypothetical protein